jgi:hypothetical protein
MLGSHLNLEQRGSADGYANAVVASRGEMVKSLGGLLKIRSVGMRLARRSVGLICIKLGPRFAH